MLLNWVGRDLLEMWLRQTGCRILNKFNILLPPNLRCHTGLHDSIELPVWVSREHVQTGKTVESEVPYGTGRAHTRTRPTKVRVKSVGFRINSISYSTVHTPNLGCQKGLHDDFHRLAIFSFMI